MDDRIEIEGMWGDRLNIDITMVAGEQTVAVTGRAGPCCFGLYYRPADARALAAAITLQAERIEREQRIAAEIERASADRIAAAHDDTPCPVDPAAANRVTGGAA